MTGGSEEAQSIKTSDAAPPLPVIVDLLSIGVCVRCIFRLFGVHACAYTCSFLTASKLLSVLEELKGCPTSSKDNSFKSTGFHNCSHISQTTKDEQGYCSICLGILQFAYNPKQEVHSTSFADQTCIDAFTITIAELVKKEGCEVADFSLEVSVPPILMANERAVWLYLKKKYESDNWFTDKFLTERITVKDALKSSLSTSLENHLAVKSGISSFRICLTYTHSKASLILQNILPKDQNCKKRKIDTANLNAVEDLHVGTMKECSGNAKRESDAVISRALNCLQDHAFCERFISPPEKAEQPCHLTTICYRMPIYISGRYLKFSRNVSQSRWIIDDERMGETSVEEIIGSHILDICRGDTYKFHAAGREDIDVRMLGSGRPFLVEVSNARSLPSSIDVQKIGDSINRCDKKYVSVRNLKVVGSEAWTLMREGEAEKQKQYAALVWISRPLVEEDLQKMSSIKNLDILQKTPIRVLHRRSPLERKRTIHWMTTEKIVGSCQYILLHLCTQAGTYIKEFVHGDLGRTHPSICTILGCRAEIVQLDVTDVKMDCFD